MNESNLIAIDLAKNVFQICMMNQHQKIVTNKKLNRSDFIEFMLNQKPATVAMEACYSSHHWGRVFEDMGHRVKLLPAQHVSPFVRGNKSDKNDAIAIAEASKRPNITPVPIKSEAQQDIQSLHRIRERHISYRTGLINQMRGLLSEYGMTAPQGIVSFKKMLMDICRPEVESVSPLLKTQLHAICEEYEFHSQQSESILEKLASIAHNNPLCKILLSIPGIGIINATAIYSAIGNGNQFSNEREFAVWLGLTPRQSSSGERFTSSGITKRGNRYLRKQLVHGARSVIYRCKNKTDKLNLWAKQLVERRGINKAAVALAAKLARTAWILLQRQEYYRAI